MTLCFTICDTFDSILTEIRFFHLGKHSIPFVIHCVLDQSLLPVQIDYMLIWFLLSLCTMLHTLVVFSFGCSSYYHSKIDVPAVWPSSVIQCLEWRSQFDLPHVFWFFFQEGSLMIVTTFTSDWYHIYRYARYRGTRLTGTVQMDLSDLTGR